MLLEAQGSVWTCSGATSCSALPRAHALHLHAVPPMAGCVYVRLSLCPFPLGALCFLRLFAGRTPALICLDSDPMRARLGSEAWHVIADQ